jgi:hypothetical protein
VGADASGHEVIVVRTRLVLAFIIAFCLFQVSSTSPRVVSAANASLTPPSVPVPADFFGIHVILGNWPTVSFGVVRSSGVGWPKIEPQKGQFSWSELDSQVAAAQQHGKKFYYATDGIPNWWGGVSSIQDFDAFVNAMVARYKGKIEVYELWNEPDQDSQLSSRPMSDFVTLTQHFHDDVRQMDPSALIASPSVTGSPDWMDSYWAAGGVTDVDAVVLHGYPTDIPSQPEIIGAQKAQPMIALMSKYGLLNKPLWDSEASWGDSSYGVTDLQQQAGFVARFFLLHWSNGFSRFYWYSWDDNGNGPGGVGWGTIFNPNTHTALPAAAAYQQVYNWMVGATMPSACTMASDSTWTCPLTRSGGFQALAVWNSNTSKSYTPASQYKQYQDLSGNTNPVNGSVTIGYNPILLTSTGTPNPPTNAKLTVK